MAVVRYDLTSDPVRLKANRWTRHRVRSREDMRGVVSHSWQANVGTTATERLRYGESLALARRASEAPYNISAGVTRHGQPIAVFAHPIERYTYASDAACRDFISIGVMGLYPFEERTRDAGRHSALSDAMFAAVDEAMRWAVELLPADGPHVLITHRQAINGRGDHIQCSGEGVVKMFLASRAVVCGRIIADPDLVLVPEFGRPWPASWRSHVQVTKGLPNIASRVSAEHQALPLMPVGEDGSAATHSA